MSRAKKCRICFILVEVGTFTGAQTMLLTFILAKRYPEFGIRLHEEINDSVLKILIIHLRNFYQDRMYCIHVPFAYTSHPEGPFCKAVIKVVIIFIGVHSQFQEYQL